MIYFIIDYSDYKLRNILYSPPVFGKSSADPSPVPSTAGSGQPIQFGAVSGGTTVKVDTKDAIPDDMKL